MKKTIISFLAAGCALLACTSQPPIAVLDAAAFHTALQTDTSAVLLDVRKPAEYAEGHLEGAININWLDTAAFRLQTEQLNREATYYIYCRSGRRSHEAAIRMQAEGFRVFDLGGGIVRWKELGMPVTDTQP